MTDDRVAVAQRVLAAQPFSSVVGARITAFGGGSATLEIDIEDGHRQQFGLVHGGVLSYAADNVLTFAAGSVLGPRVVTAGLTIHYLQAARTGILRATGTVTHHTLRRAVCTATIETVADEGAVRLCAIASGTVLETGSPSRESHPPARGDPGR